MGHYTPGWGGHPKGVAPCPKAISVFCDAFVYLTEEAERIMKEERSFLELPTGMPDYQSIEEARLKAEEKSS